MAYAGDGLSWFHFLKVNHGTPASQNNVATPSANVTTLSQSQLQDIYNGSINNWDQVGGSNAPIVVFSAQAGSGTQATWKSYMGFDPTIGGKPVNCTNPGTVNPSTGLVTGESGCVGPAVILENEDASIQINSFLSSQSSFLGANAALWGQVKGTTTLSVAVASGATTVTVASTSGMLAGSKLTFGSGPTADSATVSSISGNTVTLTSGLGHAHASGATVTFVTSEPASNPKIQADSVFFYSFGDYQHQCAESHGTVNECGGSAQNGNNPSLGQITGAPTLGETSILEGTWPVDRYVYNVYSNGSNANITHAATTATLNYISEVGFLCKPQNDQITNPATGNTYNRDIQSVIEQQGFYPLSAGMTSGTVNQTPLTDEGSVSHPAPTLIGPKYSPYDNMSGTGLVSSSSGNVIGNETASNGDPSGFCLVSSTEDDGSGNPS